MTTATGSEFWNMPLSQVEPAAARAGLGPRVRATRQQRLKLTLAEFGVVVAAEVGRSKLFSNVTVANWESNRQEPSFPTLCAIARLAGLPLCYFAGVGELDDYPRINWFTEMDHGSDARLSRLLGALGGLVASDRRLAIGAVTGLIEGLYRAGRELEEESAAADD